MNQLTKYLIQFSIFPLIFSLASINEMHAIISLMYSKLQFMTLSFTSKMELFFIRQENGVSSSHYIPVLIFHLSQFMSQIQMQQQNLKMLNRPKNGL